MGHGLSDEAALGHTSPSSVLSSLQLGSSVLGECPNMVFSGALVRAKDSLLYLSSPPSSAQGPWHSLETSALQAREDGMPAHHHLWVGGLACPSDPNVLSAAVCMVAALVIQALKQTSPPSRDLPDCPFRSRLRMTLPVSFSPLTC